jgi:hypothetical protein
LLILDKRLAELKEQIEDREKPLSSVSSGEQGFLWDRKNCILDVTVVIPINTPVFLAEDAYSQAKEVHLLSNGLGVRDAFDAQIFRVPWKGHAQTRKESIANIKTKYTFFSVQDAFPVGDMLLSLVQEYERGGWDILLPRQIPWSDCGHRDRMRILSYMPNREEVYEMLHADHVGALYRTCDLQQWALANVPIAEDVWWSQGRRVGCVPWAKLVHSHRSDNSTIFARERAIHAQLHTLGLLERPQFRNVFSSIWAKKGMKRRIISETLGQFIGFWER